MLLDVDEPKLRLLGGVAAHLARRHGDVRVVATTDARRALDGADFVVTTVRVGGDAARVADERIAVRHGVPGQETTGAGGPSASVTAPTWANLGQPGPAGHGRRARSRRQTCGPRPWPPVVGTGGPRSAGSRPAGANAGRPPLPRRYSQIATRASAPPTSGGTPGRTCTRSRRAVVRCSSSHDAAAWLTKGPPRALST
ncbi:hypothetical protein [Nonomuraea sp. FMUSA5-5]|uniref:family 4 glycosyl hydrolase n=1 Tax=Nonomuraea composti TaxID=2720023 RepID=UPI00197D76BC